MGTDKTNRGAPGGSASGPPDAEIRRIAAELKAEVARRGWSQLHVARQAGIHPSALSQFFLGKHGLGAAKLQSLLRVLGRGRAATHRPIDIDGIITARGVLQMFDGATLPATIRIDEPFDRYSPGDTLVIEPASEWEAGSTLVVRHLLDGGDRLYASLELDGLRFLRDAAGDDIRFVPERHLVIGVVTAATIIVPRKGDRKNV